MVKFPVSVTYDDTNKPDWILVIKENNENPFSLTITLEDWNRIRFDETNIEGLKVDLNKALVDAGLSSSDVIAMLTFLRVSAPRVTLVLNGTGTDLIVIVMPPGVTVSDVVRADGFRIPFTVNMAENSISFTVTFSSIVEVQLFIQSIQSNLNSAVNIIATTLIVSSVLQTIFGEIGKIIEEVRRRV